MAKSAPSVVAVVLSRTVSDEEIKSMEKLMSDMSDIVGDTESPNMKGRFNVDNVKERESILMRAHRFFLAIDEIRAAKRIAQARLTCGNILNGLIAVSFAERATYIALPEAMHGKLRAAGVLKDEDTYNVALFAGAFAVGTTNADIAAKLTSYGYTVARGGGKSEWLVKASIVAREGDVVEAPTLEVLDAAAE